MPFTTTTKKADCKHESLLPSQAKPLYTSSIHYYNIFPETLMPNGKVHIARNNWKIRKNIAVNNIRIRPKEHNDGACCFPAQCFTIQRKIWQKIQMKSFFFLAATSCKCLGWLLQWVRQSVEIVFFSLLPCTISQMLQINEMKSGTVNAAGKPAVATIGNQKQQNAHFFVFLLLCAFICMEHLLIWLCFALRDLIFLIVGSKFVQNGKTD